MSATNARVLAHLRKGSPVYLRAPDGQLSKARLAYASGKRFKTATRTFDTLGAETGVPEGGRGYTLLPASEFLEAEYDRQAGAAACFIRPAPQPEAA